MQPENFPSYAEIKVITANVLDNDCYSELVSRTSIKVVSEAGDKVKDELYGLLSRFVVITNSGYLCLPKKNQQSGYDPASVILSPECRDVVPRVRLIFDGGNAFALENFSRIPDMFRLSITSIYFSSNNTTNIRSSSSLEPDYNIGYTQLSRVAPLWEPLSDLYNPQRAKAKRILRGDPIICTPQKIKEHFPSLKCMAIAANADGFIEPSPLFVGFSLFSFGLERLEVVFQSPGEYEERRKYLWDKLEGSNTHRYVGLGCGLFHTVFPMYDSGPGTLPIRNEEGGFDLFHLFLQKLDDGELDARGRHFRALGPDEGSSSELERKCEEVEVWVWKKGGAFKSPS
ncbi:hypothetical protein TWF481_010176 [Arthrobotrys musiformis]|uniref:HNH nuclease domain-containing protein n=1 Tax=Arthrobotrys musiformis TaxID=47236 RepID=A0AAV9VZZ0_9PEZI